jgi:hypothetical protein
MGLNASKFGVVFCLVLGLALAAYADEVVLKNGGLIRGEVVRETEKTITIKTDSGLVPIPRKRVKEIIRSKKRKPKTDTPSPTTPTTPTSGRPTLESIRKRLVGSWRATVRIEKKGWFSSIYRFRESGSLLEQWGLHPLGESANRGSSGANWRVARLLRDGKFEVSMKPRGVRGAKARVSTWWFKGEKLLTRITGFKDFKGFTGSRVVAYSFAGAAPKTSPDKTRAADKTPTAKKPSKKASDDDDTATFSGGTVSEETQWKRKNPRPNRAVAGVTRRLVGTWQTTSRAGELLLHAMGKGGEARQ